MILFLLSPDGLHARQIECLEAGEVEELLAAGWQLEEITSGAHAPGGATCEL